MAKALEARNPWPALKALASRPGNSLRWVQQDELQAVIHTKASEQLRLSPMKTEEAERQTAGSSRTLATFPRQFLLPLMRWPLATGVCFCTPSQVAPFVNPYKAISVDALRLITTSEVPVKALAGAPATTVRKPAICSPMQEAVLVTGTTLQLGDASVQLTPAQDMEVDHLETCVVKLMLYRDQCAWSWEKLMEAPLRFLIHQVPKLLLRVEEIVDQLILDVWGRQFQRVGGGRQDAVSAGVFQAFLRAPLSAVSHLHRITCSGLFYEPRVEDGSGHPSFAVMWILDADADMAHNALRTCE